MKLNIFMKQAIANQYKWRERIKEQRFNLLYTFTQLFKYTSIE